MTSKVLLMIQVDLTKNELSIAMCFFFKEKNIGHYLSNGKDINKKICAVCFLKKLF